MLQEIGTMRDSEICMKKHPTSMKKRNVIVNYSIAYGIDRVMNCKITFLAVWLIG